MGDNKNEMVRGKVLRLEARLRLAEEVCESVERYRDGGADEEWAIALLAVQRWRKARSK